MDVIKAILLCDQEFVNTAVSAGVRREELFALTASRMLTSFKPPSYSIFFHFRGESLCQLTSFCLFS